jgi:hypothetical protein
MVSTIQSDVTGKQISSKESYKVSVFNRSTGTHIDIDCSHDDVKNNKGMDIIALAIKNNIKWYKLVKDEKTGKWNRDEVEE